MANSIGGDVTQFTQQSVSVSTSGKFLNIAQHSKNVKSKSPRFRILKNVNNVNATTCKVFKHISISFLCSKQAY